MNTILGIISVLLVVLSDIVLFWVFVRVSIFIFGLTMFLLGEIFPQKWHNRLHDIVSLVFFVLVLLIMSIPPLFLLGLAAFIVFIFTFPDRWFNTMDSLFCGYIAGIDYSKKS